MLSIPRLMFWSVLIVCPIAGALTLTVDLHNVTFPYPVVQNSEGTTVGVDDDTHCTEDPNWLVPAFPTIFIYDRICKDALAKAFKDLTSFDLDMEYEFLNRGATAQTTKPQIQVPRKYVASRYSRRTGQEQLCSMVIPCIIHHHTDKTCSLSRTWYPYTFLHRCNCYDRLRGSRRPTARTASRAF